MGGLVGRLDLILHAIGFAIDDDGLGLVQEAVEDRGGDAGYAANGIAGTMPRRGLCRIRRSFPSESPLLDAA
jgi:hypothetical protein